MKAFVIFLVLLTVQNLYGQNTDHSDLQRYLEKSQRQKKTANILAITGGALFISGIIVTGTDDNKFLISGQQFTGIGISLLGVISGITSVPFYISSSKNTKKAIKIAPQIGLTKIQEINFTTGGIIIEF